jgi:hypothetical protein
MLKPLKSRKLFIPAGISALQIGLTRNFCSIPEIVEKINEIIRYLNGKERKHERKTGSRKIQKSPE